MFQENIFNLNASLEFFEIKLLLKCSLFLLRDLLFWGTIVFQVLQILDLIGVGLQPVANIFCGSRIFNPKIISVNVSPNTILVIK